MDCSIARIVAASVAALVGSTFLAIDTPEVEPNETKATATIVAAMSPGDTLTGTTTGNLRRQGPRPGTCGRHDDAERPGTIATGC
jgi:hypothetical protein